VEEWWRRLGELYLRAGEIEALDSAAEAEAEAAWKLLHVGPGARILDAPCGFGRHAVRLATWGAQVWGVDLDTALLAEARRRAAESGVDMELTEGDIRNLPVPDAWADAVLNLAGSVGMFETEVDNLAVLAEAFRVLAPGGTLLVETTHRDQLVRGLEPRAWESRDGTLILRRQEFDPVSGRLSTAVTVVDESGERTETDMHPRVYSITELADLLERAGFDSVEAFAGWTRSPATVEDRLVMTGRKPA
jgi:ubiquinone/menaquinone biosynthesis C-methylase UbiE